MNESTLSVTKELVAAGTHFPVMEHFYTIQGEGFHTGTAAYFIRLAGCDVGCVWCDVKDSWYTEGYPVLTIEEIIAEVKKHPVKTIVITGGEPWMYNLNNLTSTLIKQGYKTHIETSGAHPPSGNWDWITLSPKKFKEPLPEALQRADELKVIVYNKTDFKWGEQYAEKVLEKCKLFLQPEWSKQEAMVPLIIDYAKQKPQWRISLQTHKFMDIP